MAAEPQKLSEKIARQIAQIAKESVRIDIEILRFLKEDFEEIRRIAKEQGISPAKLAVTILEGIKKGLVEGGVESLELVRDILDRSRDELVDLEKRWRDKT
ncbi:hypothetical protein [Hydrogenimonas urashimensis]|uniref:hypothetical protein n=1 Tax=Hydrogenimonas urashimensis TaxID=2740515 RepID=UPI001915CBB1|nr:hypothetical protein [Hydrogenimonas urashimensis]